MLGCAQPVRARHDADLAGGAFLAGIVGGTAVEAPCALWLGLSGASLSAAIALRRGPNPLPVLLLASACLGCWRAPHASAPGPGDLAYYNGRHATMSGIVSAEPDIRDTGANYVVSIDSLQLRGKAMHLAGKLALHTSFAVQLDYGDRVTVQGLLIAPMNTATGPWADVLARQGIASEISFPKISDQGPASTGVLGAIVRLRQHIEKGIDEWLPEPEAALLIAIALGAKSASLGDLSHPLVATGLIHLIAISGIKVSLVAGTVYMLVKRAGSRLTSLALPLLGLWSYVILTGLTASGTRSAIMWSLVFVAAALGRGTVALVSLAVASAIMVGLNPSLAWDPAFLMSAVGTAFIVAIADPISRLFRPIPSPFRQSLSVTVAAQIGTLPIVVESFHTVSFSGPLANALVLPLLPALIAIGMVLGLCAGLPAIAAPLAALAHALTHLVVLIATSLASWGAALNAVSVSLGPSLVYYVALVMAGVVILKRANWAPVAAWPMRSREFALAAVVGASGLTLTMAGASGTSDRLDWLGTGQAMLLQSHGHTALIDGSPHTFTLLERLGSTLPFDARAIELVVVTNPSAANVTGLLGVLDHYHVQEVLDVGAEYPSTTYAAWRTRLRAAGTPVYALRTGETVSIGDATVTAISPDAVSYRPADSQGMLRISLAGRTFLLSGAASVTEHHDAVFRGVRLRADVLISAGKSLDPDFVRAVRARTKYAAGSAPATGRALGSNESRLG